MPVVISRRFLLDGLIGAGTAALLAACGGASPTATTASKPADKPAGAAPTTAPAAKPAEAKPAAAEPTKPAADAAKPTAAAAPTAAGAAATTPAGASAPAPAKPLAGGQKITMRIHGRSTSVVPGGVEGDLFGVHLDKWKAANPNVEVKIEPYPPAQEEYGPKILSLHMAGTIGDVVWSATGSGSFQYLASAGVVEPLDDYVKRDNLDLNQWLPNMLKLLMISDAGQGSGKLYGLPLLAHQNPNIIFYNKTLFEKAGVKPPTETTTLDELVEIARKMTTKAPDGRPDVYGYLPARGQYNTMVVQVRRFGGELLSQDGKKAQYASPEAKQALQWMWDLHHTHKVTPTPASGSTAELFNTGKLAMSEGIGADRNTYAATKNFEWDATLTAKGPTGVRGSMYTGDAYVLPSQSKQKDAGWEMVKWFTNKEAGLLMCKSIAICGARPDVYSDPSVKDLRLQPLFNKAVEEALPFRGPANLRQVQLNDTTGQVLGRLWTGDAKPDDAFLNEANTKIQQVLDQPRQ
jgi:multiple sugar transport system substrate-binding protein